MNVESPNQCNEHTIRDLYSGVSVDINNGLGARMDHFRGQEKAMGHELDSSCHGRRHGQGSSAMLLGPIVLT